MLKTAAKNRLDLIRSVANRYSTCSRFSRYFVPAKLRLDPVHNAMLDLAMESPFGAVTDVGCGYAQLALLLLEAQAADNVIGIDCDPSVLRDARRAAGELALTLEEADAGTSRIPDCDTVLLIDVLYQLPTDTQKLLLRRAAAVARSAVVIRNVAPDQGWRTIVTRVSEALLRGLRLKHSAIVNPRPTDWFVGILEASGFTVAYRPCSHGTPFASMLFVAIRR